MANLTVQLRSLKKKLLVTILVAIALSVYGLYVEIKHDFSQSYVALCDLSASISCSAAFLTEYGKGFGILPEALAFRNPIYGLAFYAVLLGLILFGTNAFHAQLVLGLSILSNLASIYLGYILAFVLHVACVVCISIYIANFVLMFFAYRRWKLTQRLPKLQSKRQ